MDSENDVSKYHTWVESFSLRNFLCEYSMDKPNDLNSSVVKCKAHRPTFHVFGITHTGEKACVHVHGVLPYIVLRVGGEMTGRVENLMKGKLNRILHRELLRKRNETVEAADSRISSENLVPKEYIYKIETFQARSMYGFQPEAETFARVYFTTPVHCIQLFTALTRDVEQNPGLQPFESHYPFTLQFFMDHSLFGMDLVHFSKVQYRISTEAVERKELAEHLRSRGLLSSLEPLTTCSIECDAYSTNILNAEMHKDNVHSSNPGLEYIWKEEAARCELQHRPLEDTFNSYASRPYPNLSNERKLLNKLRRCLRDMRARGDIVSNGQLSLTQNLNDSVIGVSVHESLISGNSIAENVWSQDNDQEWDVVPEPLGDAENQIPDYGTLDPDDCEDDIIEEDMNELATPRPDGSVAESQLTELADDDDYSSDEDFEDEDEISVIEAEEEPSPKRIKVKKEKLELAEPQLREMSFCSDEIDSNEELCSSTSESSDDDDFISEWFRLENDIPLRCKMKPKKVITTAAPPQPSTAEDKPATFIPVDKSVHNKFLMVNSPLDGTAVHNMTSPDNLADLDGEISEVAFLTVASLEVVTHTTHSIPNPAEDPIVGVSISVFDDVCRTLHPCLHQFITTIDANILPDKRCLWVETEKELMNQITQIVRKFDPDILVGYDVDRLSWGYLMKRSDVLGMSSFSVKIGRYQSDTCSYLTREGLIGSPRGRVMEAVWRAVRRDLQLRSYDRGTSCLKILKQKIPVFDERTLSTMMISFDRKLVFSGIRHMLRMSYLNVALLNEMDFFLRNAEMARVYGIQFHEVWTRGTQLRVESMLLRLARCKAFVAPSISVSQRNKMCAPEQLQLIIEPKSGVYHDPVIVLDFQSLYPSMCIAYNYCFSSVFGKIIHLNSMFEEGKDSIELGATQYSVPKNSLVTAVASRSVHSSPLSTVFIKEEPHRGLIPILLKELLGARIMVKASMKHTKSKRLLRILDARQLALKLVANVTYGYTAANWSGRMPCVEVADAILGKGRETLERAIATVRKGDYCGAEVIYGDTDSMFVHMKGASIKEAFEIGKRIAEDVTNDNPVPVVLKLEKVYAGCVLETKKRYAGWKLESPDDKGSLESKGIETIRRDTCPVVAKFLERSLKLIFQGRYSALINFLEAKLANVDQLPFTDFVFCKEYRGGYSENAPVPQKKIACELVQSSPAHVLMHGERIPYVVVQGEICDTVISSVRSVDEFLKSRTLKINYGYYVRAHIVAALKRVTDLISIKIQCESLSGVCYRDGCRILGTSPWCVLCELDPSNLISTQIDVSRNERIRYELQRVCDSCIGLKFSNGVHCYNYSCLTRQALAQIDRSGAFEALATHSLNDNVVDRQFLDNQL